MYYLVFKFITMLSCAALISCRSSKPANTFYEVNDTLAVSIDTSFSLCQDSSVKTEDKMTHVCGVVEFIDSGGSISVVADGSLVMSGVTSLHSSRLDASSGKEDNSSSSLQIQRKDSLSSSKKEAVHSEFQVKDSNFRRFLMKCIYISIIVILVLTLILVKIRHIRERQV